MGSFSWNKADKLTEIENVAYGTSFKFLIPQEFGGGFIKDVYQDYGYLGTKEDGEPKYDMYELQAFWNKAEGLLAGWVMIAPQNRGVSLKSLTADQGVQSSNRHYLGGAIGLRCLGVPASLR